ncbi:hypothetical protein ILYODFUR_031794 [Ilyodon furcidens]|uniref:Uncharacterized protein n=1 Tax=Ilyodon furcidens TaxID=33524 RepID=A0ABV0TCQ7_9TELE
MWHQININIKILLPVKPLYKVYFQDNIETCGIRKEYIKMQLQKKQNPTAGASVKRRRSAHRALCRSFIRSLSVVLGFLVIVLMIILTPLDEILSGDPDPRRLSMVSRSTIFLLVSWAMVEFGV